MLVGVIGFEPTTPSSRTGMLAAGNVLGSVLPALIFEHHPFFCGDIAGKVALQSICGQVHTVKLI